MNKIRSNDESDNNNKKPLKIGKDFESNINNEHIKMKINLSKTNRTNNFASTIKKAICKDSLCKLLNQKSYKLNMREYTKYQDEGNGEQNQTQKITKFFKKTFKRIFEFSESINYVKNLCENPELYYNDDIEEMTYYDVNDYFREPHPFLKNDGGLVLTDDDKKDRESHCIATTYCWANRSIEDNGGGFGIILRSFKSYGFCICCLRESVNNTFSDNSFNDNIISCNQPHFYTVDKDPIEVDGKTYFNYSSSGMLYQEDNKPFLGIYGPYPIHHRDRFKQNIVIIKKKIEIDGHYKIIELRGIEEKQEVFYILKDYTLFEESLGNHNIEYGLIAPNPLNHFLSILETTEFYNRLTKDNFIIKNYILEKRHSDDSNDNLYKRCSMHNFKLPCSLKVADYKNTKINNEALGKMIDKGQDFKTFCYRNEDSIRKDVFDMSNNFLSTQNETFSSDGSDGDGDNDNNLITSIEFEDYDNLYKSHLSSLYKKKLSIDEKRRNIFDNRVLLKEREEYKKNNNIPKFFVYWKPENATADHIKLFFHFFVRINSVLQLLKCCSNNVALSKYLKQIYLHSIPYIILIEEFYFNKRVVMNVLAEYYSSFKLKYEFSTNYVNCRDYKDYNFEITSIKPNPTSKKKIIPFEKQYFSKHKKRFRREFSIGTDFGFYYYKKTRGETNKTWRVTQVIFYLLKKYKNKLPKNIKNLFSLIPMLFYLIKNDFPDDIELSNDSKNIIKYYPVNVPKKEYLFFNVFHPTNLSLVKCMGASIISKKRGKRKVNNNQNYDENDEEEEEEEEEMEYSYIKRRVGNGKKGRKKLFIIKVGGSAEKGRKLYTITMFHFMPFYLKIKSFEENFQRFYVRNPEYRKFIDNAIMCSVLGLYKWSNIRSIFNSDKSKEFNCLLKIILEFYEKFLDKDNSVLKKLEYIKTTFLETGYIKHVLLENILFLFNRNPSVLNILFNKDQTIEKGDGEDEDEIMEENMKNDGSKKKKKKNEVENNLDFNIANFRFCVVQNSNKFRFCFYMKNVGEEKIDFLHTKKRRRKLDIYSRVLKDMKYLKNELFFVKTIIGKKLPENFEFIYDFDKMGKMFGVSWKIKILQFWSTKQFYVPLDEKCSEYIINKFKIVNETDKKAINNIFNGKLERDRVIRDLRNLSMMSRSIIFYVFWFYKNKTSVVKGIPFPTRQYLYHHLLRQFMKVGNKNKNILNVGVSNCCKMIHNSNDGFGYSNISINLDKNEYNCSCKIHKPKKPSILTEENKYHFFAKESHHYIKKIVHLMFNESNKTFERCKKLILNEDYGDDEDDDDEEEEGEDYDEEEGEEEEEEEEEEGEQEQEREKSFYELLSNSQKNLISKKKLKLDYLDINDYNKKEDDKWIGITSANKCKSKIVKEVEKLKKFASFLRKMCKWITLSKLKIDKIKDRTIELYDPCKYFFIEKKQTTSSIKYKVHRLCLDCFRVMPLNEKRQFDIYSYCCKMCEDVEVKEKLNKVLIVDLKQPYYIARVSSK